tara:strand:+ start:1682 stop:2884 length:1203 start_codon:yes stop_codon:yes gene_type:complete
MTIQEMHIAVNLGVQKIASFQADSLLPEEIDYELNTAVRRFISQRYNKHGNKYRRGFEQSQKRLDDLRHLVEDYTTERHSYMGIGYTSKSKGNIDIYRYKFPTDYMFLVNVLSEVVHDCTNTALPTTERFLNKEYLKIPLTPPQPGYLIQSISIADQDGSPLQIIYGQEGLSYDQLIGPFYNGDVTPSLSNNDSFTDRYFDSVSADSPPADGNELYLEKVYYDRDQQESKFHQFVDNDVTDEADYTNAYAVMTWVNPSTGETLEQVNNLAPNLNATVERIARITQGQPNIKLYRTNCKFSQQDDIYALLDDPFNSTSERGILYTVQETFLDLYTNASFMPNSVQIKYIRKPAQMSKRFGVGCELPEHTHHEIVEMAVKSILEGFESPRYQTQSREVLDSE